MSLFDKVGDVLRGQVSGAGGEQFGLVTGVLEMLGKGKEGGLAGLVQVFQAKGLGDVVSSWISTGPNLPISGGQIREGLGKVVGQLAGQTGMSSEVLSAKLAEILPGAIDRLTPDGKIPEGGALEQMLGLLKSKFS
jgi:uncharacterized protein YidB (DUF937 family)